MPPAEREVKQVADYRTEWKYICTDGQLELLQSRLGGLLPYDSHSAADGTYPVSSLYFDDFTDSSAASNEAGDGLRFKYRIRHYGQGASGLHLERKEKRYGLGGKVSCPVTRGEYDALLSGNVSEMFWSTEKPLLREFCAQIMTRCFSPKVIIDYERTAFAEPAAHIRITLDRCISAGYDVPAFLEGDYLRFPLQCEHQNVLEVKFDTILPGWIRKMIESLHVQQTAFSKYYLGRKQLEDVLR